MKKKVLTLAVIMSFGSLSIAQSGNDHFFGKTSTYNNRTTNDPTWNTPSLPSDFGMAGDQDIDDAPLGTGLFLLTALGAGYAISKRRKEAR